MGVFTAPVSWAVNDKESGKICFSLPFLHLVQKLDTITVPKVVGENEVQSYTRYT